MEATFTRRFETVRPARRSGRAAAVGQLPAHRVTHLVVFTLAAIALVSAVHGARPVAPALTAAHAFALHAEPAGLAMSRDQFLRVPAMLTTTQTIAPTGTAAASAPRPNAVLAASQPAASRPVRDYVVQPGESLSLIAARNGLSTAALAWSNNLSDADFVSAGAVIQVPPAGSVLHRVASGQTLSGIAALYQVSARVIQEYAGNNLANADTVVVGQVLVIPGATVPSVVRAPAADRSTPRNTPQAPAPATAAARAVTQSGPATGTARPNGAVVAGTGFVWPTRGPIFTYFSGYHPGIDISPPFGTPIYATQGGTVVNLQRTSYGYGWYLDIDHGNGYMSRYAHVSAFMVGLGQVVRQGQHIANVGSTGNSSGPHVHFEVYRNGVPVNPLGLLQ